MARAVNHQIEFPYTRSLGPIIGAFAEGLEQGKILASKAGGKVQCPPLEYDPYTGESVKALVVRRAGSSLTADEVIAHCAASLARFKCPTAVEFVETLPYSATGKVSKGKLRLADKRAREAS